MSSYECAESRLFKTHLVFQIGLMFPVIISDSFPCKCDGHCMSRSDLEPIESFFSRPRLFGAFEFHECNVVATRYQTHFFVTRKPEIILY